jgi:23S rRNA pseudouridine1911/1915/1917 synthase
MTEHPDTIDESQDLYEHYRFTADKGQGLLRIDKFLMARIENASRTKIQNASKAGNILVNGLPVKSNYKVKPHDLITIVLTFPPREIEIIPEDIPVEILYEDDDIIVVNKRAGMVVHPAYGNYRGTLVNALAYHFQSGSPGESLIQAPFLVHRIDKDTSGVMVAAKNEIAQARLAKEFFDHTIERKYNALVWGDFDQETGTITGNIGRNIHDRKKFAVFTDGSHGKHAVTHYRVLERFGYVTLVECQLETGRTHQIRTHFAWIKHPLFNDETYGGNIILKGTTFTKYRQFINNCFTLLPRQALHARSLGFSHPATRKPMYFESNLPEDMAAVIEKWRNYVKSNRPGE